MAVAIPQAFGDHALLFAGSYVAIQVGRHTFLTFVASAEGTLERSARARILVWFRFAARSGSPARWPTGRRAPLLWIDRAGDRLRRADPPISRSRAASA